MSTAQSIPPVVGGLGHQAAGMNLSPISEGTVPQLCQPQDWGKQEIKCRLKQVL